jgi:surface polysaccharide O-acyltransferase-like enzyme
MNSINNSSNRLYSIDFLKAISIFGVVYIHCSFRSGLFGCSSDISEILRGLFRFGVPCFIILWAYFIEKALQKSDKLEQYNYFKKKIVHLFVVFIIWSLGYFFYSVNWQTLTFIDLFTKYFSGYGWAGQYYFVVLFQLLLLFPILRQIYNIKTLKIGVIILTLFIYIIFAYLKMPSIIDKLGYRLFLYWVIYVFVGIALARNSIQKISIWWLLLVVLMPLEELIMKSLGVFQDLNDYIRPTIIFVSTIISIIAIQTNIKQNNKIISFIGKNTMTVYVANPLVAEIIHKTIPDLCFSNCSVFGKIVIPLFATIVVLCFCLLIDKIIRLFKFNGILN